MRMKKTAATLAIAGLAAALAPAGAATAKPAKPTGKFLVQVVGTQTTTWDEPRRNLWSDCKGQEWKRGAGQETVEFRTKETRVLITDTGRVPRLKYGTWNARSKGAGFIGGLGTVDRTGEEVNGIDPDPRCFKGGPTETNTGPYDCRVIPVAYEVDIDWADTLAAVANPPMGTTPRYENCPHKAPHPVIPTRFTPVRSEPFKAKQLFSRKTKSHKVTGAADYRSDTGLSVTETKVRWTITFKRVK